MAAQQKPKAASKRGDLNTSRPNGKSSKKHPGQHRGGRSKTSLSNVELALLGKGMLA